MNRRFAPALLIALLVTLLGSLALSAAQTEIYSASADPNADIAAALRKAAATHRRVLLDFGANWCPDCHALEADFHRPEMARVLRQNYLVVHIDVGEFNRNLAVAEKYEIPLKRGIPALAVLDGDGKLVFSQKQGEFENARSLAPKDVLAFLNRWKPAAS